MGAAQAELTPIMLRTLALLRKYGNSRCSWVGSMLWGIRKGSSNPGTLPAGAVLARMRKLGLVYWENSEWGLTAKGRQLAPETFERAPRNREAKS